MHPRWPEPSFHVRYIRIADDTASALPYLIPVLMYRVLWSPEGGGGRAEARTEESEELRLLLARLLLLTIQRVTCFFFLLSSYPPRPCFRLPLGPVGSINHSTVTHFSLTVFFSSSTASQLTVDVLARALGDLTPLLISQLSDPYAAVKQVALSRALSSHW